MAENASAGGHTARFNAYKNRGRDIEDLRRRRVETSVEIRKQKKEETLLKRRNVELSDDEPASPLQEQNKQHLMPMSEIISSIKSSDSATVQRATESVRRLLSREKNPPIDKVIEAGLVNTLVSFLDRNDKPNLQFEAAWALTNIASGTSEQTQAVVRAGALPHFIRLLGAPSMNLVEQCVWALGNIAGDGAELRDMVTAQGVIEPLLRLVDMSAPSAFLRNVTWTFSNLCRNKNPPPKMKAIQACLPALRTLINHPDREVLADTCWALSYITDGPNNQIQEVVDLPGVLPRVVELLGSSDAAVVTPALRAVGNIVTGDDCQTQAVLDSGVLQMMPGLLQHAKSSIKKEACWLLSNVTAGSTDQIQDVINHNLLPLVIEVLCVGDFKSQKEAAWAITNLTSGGTLEQIGFAVQCGVLKPMCDLLSSKDTKLVHVLLDGIVNILGTAEKIGQAESVCIIIEEVGGLDKIEQLQNHENAQVYKKAYEIIEKYFSAEEEDKNLAPEDDQENNQYQFNTSNINTAQGFNF